MLWRKLRAEKRKKIWNRRVAQCAVAVIALGCAREIRVSSVGGIAGAAGKIPSILGSTPGVDPSKDPSAGVAPGSPDYTVNLYGSYLLQRYQCMTENGDFTVLQPSWGSQGKQSNSLVISSGHLHELVTYSGGCTVILDYDILNTSVVTIKASNRRYTVQYLEAPDTAGNCKEVAPNSGQSSDNYYFNYEMQGANLVLYETDNPSIPACGPNEKYQEVFLRN